MGELPAKRIELYKTAVSLLLRNGARIDTRRKGKLLVEGKERTLAKNKRAREDALKELASLISSRG